VDRQFDAVRKDVKEIHNKMLEDEERKIIFEPLNEDLSKDHLRLVYALHSMQAI
jgi:hypothetical protein